MEENIISFNFTNWITVVVMAAAGFVVFSLLAQFWHHSGSTDQSTVG